MPGPTGLASRRAPSHLFARHKFVPWFSIPAGVHGELLHKERGVGLWRRGLSTLSGCEWTDGRTCDVCMCMCSVHTLAT